MCMCWCLMQFVCIVHLYWLLNWPVSSTLHSMKATECDNIHAHTEIHTLTLTLATICGAPSVSARTIVNVNVCQKQHMLLYTFQPLPLPRLLLLLVTNTHRRAPCKHTANNNALLQQICDFQLGAFFIKRKAALAAATAAATARIKWVHCLFSFVFVPSFVSHLLNLYTHLNIYTKALAYYVNVAVRM